MSSVNVAIFSKIFLNWKFLIVFASNAGGAGGCTEKTKVGSVGSFMWFR